MPYYLMLDHGGVLDGDVTSTTPSSDDLVLGDLGDGAKNVLKNGVAIVQKLNDLTKSGYQIVFHSKNREQDQLRIYEQLRVASARKDLIFPTITAMAVYDPDQFSNVLSSTPTIITNRSHGIMVAGYGVDTDGKSCVRKALCSALKITVQEHSDCFVFDDGLSIIVKAQTEGYNTYQIGNEANTLTLLQAISEVHALLPSTNLSNRR